MASGDSLMTFFPADQEPNDSLANARPDSRNSHPVLDFSPSTDEYGVFTRTMPRNYDGGGITAYVTGTWSSDTTNTHTADIDCLFERIGDAQHDIDSNGFAAAQTAVLTVNSTSGLTDVAAATFTNGAQMDSVAVGELFRFACMCDTSDSDFTGDFEFHSVELVET